MIWIDEDTIAEYVLGLLIGALVLALVAGIYKAYRIDQARTDPSGYSDTVKLVIGDIQSAKAHWAKVGDQEKYEYWADMESNLMGKLISEGEK